MKEKLVELVMEIYGNNIPVNDDTSLSADLSFDSMQYIQLVVSIEVEYNFEFSEEHLDMEILDRLGNIDNIIDLYSS